MSNVSKFSVINDIGIIEIDSPPVNALSIHVRKGIISGLEQAWADDKVKAIIIICAGRTFFAGADIKEFGKPPMSPGLSEVLQTMEERDKPVIAAVAGPAVAGGMELALWCDFRVMEQSAYFGVYCRRWGIPLIDGGTVRLPRLVGEGRAREIILTGRKVTASESLKIGLAEHVVADNESRAKAEALAHDIAKHPQTCVRADRRSLNHQHGKTVHEAMTFEWYNGRDALFAEGLEGAGRFGKPSGTD